MECEYCASDAHWLADRELSTLTDKKKGDRERSDRYVQVCGDCAEILIKVWGYEELLWPKALGGREQP